MEPRPLTTWEQKERDGLLALETDAWRQKRRIAEDPNTTADTLEVLASLVLAARNQSRRDTFRSVLLGQALLTHPNTPPAMLLALMGGKFLWARAFYRNTILPLVALETPSFWEQAGQRNCLTLLREENISPSLAVQFTRHSNKLVTEAATFHISLAGEIQTVNEGSSDLTEFWRAYCLARRKNHASYYQHHHRKLAEWGLAPAWAVGASGQIHQHDDSYTERNYTSPQEFLNTTGARTITTAFEQFVANLYDAFRFLEVYRGGARSPDWRVRLNAALRLPLMDKTVVYDKGERWDLSTLDFWNRSPLDLLQHLAHDGNRFVRWAAQTRLADPNFVFTWHEGE